MKFHGDDTLAMKEPSGHLSRKTMVSGVGASTASTALYCSWRLDMTPGGGKMILSYDAFTSLEVSTLPSWNFTPWRTLNVYVRLSPETVHDSAMSPMNFVPVLSVGSTRMSVLYCGPTGWSIPNVSSRCPSKLGGSAAP